MTTLLCIFLTPKSTAGFLVVLWKVVAAAAIERPALERRVTRLNVEENSLAVLEGRRIIGEKEKVGCRDSFNMDGSKTKNATSKVWTESLLRYG